MSEPTQAKPTLPSMSMHWRNIRSGVFEAHCARDGQVYVARLFSCCLLRLHRVFVARCTLHVRVLQGPTSLTDIEWEMNCNGLTLLDLPPDRADWAYPCHICAGTGLTPATSAPGLRSPCHTCTRTGLTPSTSAPGLGSLDCKETRRRPNHRRVLQILFTPGWTQSRCRCGQG